MENKGRGITPALAAGAVIFYILLSNGMAYTARALINLALGNGFTLDALPAVSDNVVACVNIFIRVVSMGLPIIIFSRFTDKNELSRPTGPYTSRAFALLFTVIIAGNMLGSYISDAVKRMGVMWESAEIVADWSSPVAVILVVLQFVVVPAFFEEFLFRGVLIGIMKNDVGERSAVLFSAMMFTVLHADPTAWPGIFLLGWFFGWVAVKTKSILPTILMHLLNNGLAVLTHYCKYAANDELLYRINMLLIIFAFIGSFFIFGLYMRPSLAVGRRLSRRGAKTPFAAWIPVLAVLGYAIYLCVETAVKV